MIHDTKDDSIRQDSSQEPSTSTKYDFQDGGSWPPSSYARDPKFGTHVKKH